MRIEEIQNNMYIKSVDTVEQYLLNIIKNYFEKTDKEAENSIEVIIQEAVDRMYNDMDYNGIGVLTITLPNGKVLPEKPSNKNYEDLVKDVTITLDDLGGEPLIPQKLSAFNVNFGNQANTACEGNDPRLYDARKPLKHTHQISDIPGLEGLIATILSQNDKTKIYNHSHNNKSVLDKLVYSGEKLKIDLTVLDTLDTKIDNLVEQIKQNIIDYTEQTNTKIENTNQLIIQLNNKIDEIKEFVINKCEEYLTEAKNFTNTIFQQSVESTKTYIDNNYVNKSDIYYLINIAKNCYTFAGSERWALNEMFYQLNNTGNRSVSLDISDKILNELQRREIAIGDSYPIFKFYIEYINENGKTVKQPLPYIDNFDIDYEPYIYPVAQKKTISGYIKAIKENDDQDLINLIFIADHNQLPANIKNSGHLIMEVYAKDLCPDYPQLLT